LLPVSSMCPTRQVMLGRVTHPSTRRTYPSCGRLAHRLDGAMHISWQLLSAFSLAACLFKVTRLVPHYISIAASHCISFLRDYIQYHIAIPPSQVSLLDDAILSKEPFESQLLLASFFYF
jgi:hypothetical protein